MSLVHRLSAIRQLSGFTTVFDESVLVLAKTISIDILTDVIRKIYLRRLEYPGQIKTLKVEERKTAMRKWQLERKVNISPCP